MNEAMNTPESGGSEPSAEWPLGLAEVGRLLPQFAILRLLGTGDVGAVYHALGADGQAIAVKVLPLELSSVPGFAESVADVVRQVTLLKHPAIAALRTFGRTPDGHIFLVSDFVDGEPLSQRIGSARFIAPQAYTLVEQVCDALHHAHGHRVVHGGLHPDNIFIDRSGGAKLVDFGLVPLVALGNANNECSSHVAPEQEAGCAIDHRADLFSAGVILYELLTGELPHENSLPASQVAHVNPRIDSVIAKAMSFSPEQRYHNAAEMMRAIIAVGMLDGVKPAVLPPQSSPAKPAAAAPSPSDSSPVVKRTAAVRKWTAIGAGGIGLALGAFLIFKPAGPGAGRSRPNASVPEFPGAIVDKPEEKRPLPVETSPSVPPPKPEPKPKAPDVTPGQWQSVALDQSIGGATLLEGGGIGLTKSVRFEKFRGKDLAVRSVLRLAEEPKDVQVWLRAAPQSRVQIKLTQKPVCVIQTTVGDNKFKAFGEVTAPWAMLGDRWVTVELAAIGDQLIGAVNDRPIEVKMPSDVLEAGSVGIFSPGGEFRSLEVAILDGVPREQYPEFVKKALDAGDALLAKAAAEAKPMAPPEPEKPKTSPEVEQWLAKIDEPFRAAYDREVAKPFESGVGELRRSYIQNVERLDAAATTAGRLEEAKVWHKEREIFFGNGQNLPPDDSDNPIPSIKAFRASFRAAFARFDRERFERARIHFAKYDAVLTPNLTALTQRERLDDALLLKARREQLTKEWLTPPMTLAPISSAPPLGSKLAAEPPKPSVKETIDWLLQNQAVLEMHEGTKWSRVLKTGSVPPGRIGFGLRIDGAKVNPSLTAADLRRLVALRTVHWLELTNQFDDAAFGFLREIGGLHRLQIPGDKTTDALVDSLSAQNELKSFQIRNGAGFTGKTLGQLAKFPALHEIDVEGSGFNDEGAAAVAQIDSIDELNVRRTRVTDTGLAQIAKLKNLKRLEIDHCAGITAQGLAALKTLRNLATLDYLGGELKDYAAAVKTLSANCTHVSFTRLRGRELSGDHIAPLAEWRSLTHLAMPDAGFVGDGAAALAKLTRIDYLEITNAVFTDADAEHLLGLKELRKLNLSGTQITDAGLAKLRTLKGLKELSVNGTKVTLGGVRQLERDLSGCKVNFTPKP